MEMIKEEGIRIMLKTIGSASFHRIEIIRGQISYYLPVTIRGPNVLESLPSDITDMKGLVFFIKQESAWSNKPISGHLNDKWGAVAAGVSTTSLILDP